MNRSGYTLIELILLAAIIVILLSAAVPKFSRTFSAIELSEASFKFARLVSYAQEKAILENSSYKIALDHKKARYCLSKNDSKTAGLPGRFFSLPRRTRLSSDKKEVIFYPDGHSDKAVVVFSGRNTNIEIRITGKLGNVRIKKGAR